ncbi:MAG: hypothetical protein GOU97_01650 [Nanoarchaeota archaeon]|nr:hypothetical protein [Nanoarchaeota archaeon]
MIFYWVLLLVFVLLYSYFDTRRKGDDKVARMLKQVPVREGLLGFILILLAYPYQATSEELANVLSAFTTLVGLILVVFFLVRAGLWVVGIQLRVWQLDKKALSNKVKSKNVDNVKKK